MKGAEDKVVNCYQVYHKLRSMRNESELEIKQAPKELDDGDIDDLIVFWSK